jgi:hypothetical protein
MRQQRPPKHLSREAKAIWSAIVRDYEIDEAAEMILASTLEARDRREEARSHIEKGGAVFNDRFGQPKISPWHAIERDQTLLMQRGFRLLGFDQEPRGDAGRP